MMERGEPVLVPEWYKAAHNGTAGLSSHSDSGTSSRNRLLVSAGDPNSLRSPPFGDRSPSFIGSRDKDSHPYSSFGRNRRDRERERDVEPRGRDRVRDRPSLVDDIFHDHSDLYRVSSKDRLRRSHSMGRQMESWKRPGSDTRNDVVSAGSVTRGAGKSFLQKDFPSLRADEKLRVQDRVSSPGIGSAIQSLPMGSSATIGSEVWSALVDAPAPQTPSATTGLNMAELVQAPSRVRTPPQLSVDTKVDELTLRQSKQLIPVTPAMPKTLIWQILKELPFLLLDLRIYWVSRYLANPEGIAISVVGLADLLGQQIMNPSERSKSRGTRGDLGSLPKLGQQTSSQIVNHALRPKTSQTGNFQVLNRERSGISPIAKDVPAVSRAVNQHSVVASAAASPSRTPLSPKLKSDSKGKTLSSPGNYFGEKRPLSQAQNRNDFFNTLRNKTSMNHSSANCEPSTDSSSSSEKFGEQNSGTCSSADPKSQAPATDPGLNCSVENGNGVSGGSDTCARPEMLLSGNKEDKSCPKPIIDLRKELAFLKSLGWEENAGEELLTAEEIDNFRKMHEKKIPYLKLSRRGVLPAH